MTTENKTKAQVRRINKHRKERNMPEIWETINRMNRNKKFMGVKELYNKEVFATMGNNELIGIINKLLKETLNNNGNNEINDILNDLEKLECGRIINSNINKSIINRYKSPLINLLNYQQHARKFKPYNQQR